MGKWNTKTWNFSVEECNLAFVFIRFLNRQAKSEISFEQLIIKKREKDTTAHFSFARRYPKDIV